jgi:flagellar FliJ protein
MTRPFSLQTVLELMQTRADDATQNLARLIASERDAKSKLELLQQYRDEYAARFQQAAQSGISPREWHNYREFLGRLDEAIDVQRKTVAQQARNTAAGQLHWQEQRKRLKAIDTLSDRHFAAENARELKREQKTQDEFAARYKSEKKAQ